MDNVNRLNGINLRIADKQDAPKLLEIYAPYVEKTPITFEDAVPSLAEFEQRIALILEKYPYLIAEQDGIPLGYSYASTFKARAAYSRAVETTIYVRRDCKKRGIGRTLYTALEQILSLQNVLNCNACIAYADAEDPYLNRDSVHFHRQMGYRRVGKFNRCGYKFGRWYHVIWMEKHLGVHSDHPLDFQSFPAIRQLVAAQYGIA